VSKILNPTQQKKHPTQAEQGTHVRAAREHNRLVEQFEDLERSMNHTFTPMELDIIGAKIAGPMSEHTWSFSRAVLFTMTVATTVGALNTRATFHGG